ATKNVQPIGADTTTHPHSRTDQTHPPVARVTCAPRALGVQVRTQYHQGWRHRVLGASAGLNAGACRLDAHVETSQRNCAPWSRIVLRARCSIPCWRIVFSTFRNLYEFLHRLGLKLCENSNARRAQCWCREIKLDIRGVQKIATIRLKFKVHWEN